MDDDSTNNLAELFDNLAVHSNGETATLTPKGKRQIGGRVRSSSESATSAELKRERFKKSNWQTMFSSTTSSSTSQDNEQAMFDVSKTSTLLHSHSEGSTSSPSSARGRSVSLSDPPQKFGLVDFFVSLTRSPSTESMSSTASSAEETVRRNKRMRALSTGDADFAMSSSGMGL
eukprot:m.239697 g.239697  ORF g.239697 m.239697 type:complete len:174 (-) comp13974_c0_seq1:415-936(-)